MSKIMSMFEKLNLVEKVEEQTSKNSENAEDTETSTLVESKPDESKSSTKEKPQKKINFNSEKNQSIEEIYSKFGMSDDGNNSIFMLEKFINALPEKLPLDMKKDTVLNILNASNTKLEVLIADGNKRLEILDNFSKEFNNSTTQTIRQIKAEIQNLNDLIKSYEEQIYMKESILIEQNNLIKTESEKLNNTIKMFKNS